MKREYAYQNHDLLAVGYGKRKEDINKIDRAGEIIEINCVKSNGKGAGCWNFWNQSEMTTDKWIFLGLFLGNLPGFLLKVTQIFLIRKIDTVFTAIHVNQITTVALVRGIFIGLVFYIGIPLLIAFFFGPETISKFKYFTATKKHIPIGKILYILAWIFLGAITFINIAIDIATLGKPL